MRELHRSWSNIADITPDSLFDPKSNRLKHVAGFVEIIRRRMQEGWNPFFLTFQFRQLPGAQRAVLYQMRTGIELVYRRLITRVERNPIKNTDRLPVLLACADAPVPKRSKKAISEVSVNDGLHQHGIILVPRQSRLREDLVSHLARHQARYRAGTQLESIHAEPVNDNLERTVRYAFKAFERGRVDYDDAVLSLPRARSEIT